MVMTLWKKKKKKADDQEKSKLTNDVRTTHIGQKKVPKLDQKPLVLDDKLSKEIIKAAAREELLEERLLELRVDKAELIGEIEILRNNLKNLKFNQKTLESENKNLNVKLRNCSDLYRKQKKHIEELEQTMNKKNRLVATLTDLNKNISEAYIAHIVDKKLVLQAVQFLENKRKYEEVKKIATSKKEDTS